jgi:outer membrane protein
MKNVMKILVLTVALMIGSNAIAQNLKFGHINTSELLVAMPEREAAQKELQEYAKKLEDQLEIMQVEYNKKVQEYLQAQESLSPIIKQTKEKELQELQNRIQEFQYGAQEDLQQKETQLIQPILLKAETAIKEVAKERNLIYVFDVSSRVVLYFSDASENILPFVKTKLGIN